MRKGLLCYGKAGGANLDEDVQAVDVLLQEAEGVHVVPDLALEAVRVAVELFAHLFTVTR